MLVSSEKLKDIVLKVWLMFLISSIEKFDWSTNENGEFVRSCELSENSISSKYYLVVCSKGRSNALILLCNKNSFEFQIDLIRFT